ncbi:hypothetical protein M1247_04420 [Mycobacterium sp. 21AC1]|uniref:hypothetical protein n=1 Tax=[Mycobacterium] appelbergii TaxID=2939269 RepID=UPI00293902F3|nr:hypothetical protein [Mycobacterium sp. 21AC1]MDV3124147.1 hypothetical protein [Mycobacterium sp. 21AC1]
MSKLTTTSVVKNDVVKSNVVKNNAAAHASVPAPVLITEQQVLFSTAAAAPLPPRRHHAHTVSSAVTWWLTRSERKGDRHDYPSRLTFLETSLMSREMYRL